MTMVVSVAPEAHRARATKDHRAVLTQSPAPDDDWGIRRPQAAHGFVPRKRDWIDGFDTVSFAGMTLVVSVAPDEHRPVRRRTIGKFDTVSCAAMTIGGYRRRP